MSITSVPTDLIGLSEAARRLPVKRGKRVHTSTLVRWGKMGRIRLYDSNGLKVSAAEIAALAKPRLVNLPKHGRTVETKWADQLLTKLGMAS